MSEIKPAPNYKKHMLGDTKLFMGNERSAARAYELLSDLHRAIEDTATMEQLMFHGGPFGEEKKQFDDMRERRNLTAAKIYFALTGTIPVEVKSFD